MRILVTGASGFVGSLLIPRLLHDRHDVRAFGRDPTRLRRALAAADGTAAISRSAETVEAFGGDALTGEGLERALHGVDVAYYLIHSMERTRGSGSPQPFAQRERIAAENFATAAKRARVHRIVYLGGLVPRWQTPQQAAGTPISHHLASREEVERILLEAIPDSLALRASIVIGARSRSFRVLVRLVERLPVLTLPAWESFHTQPIDARDVIEMLAAAATVQSPNRSLETGGPDMLSYGEMLTRIAELMLINRPAVRFKANLTRVTARVTAAITNEDPDLVVPLMEGLQGDLIPRDDRADELLGVRLHTFDSAVEHSLAEWERVEPLAAR